MSWELIDRIGTVLVLLAWAVICAGLVLAWAMRGEKRHRAAGERHRAAMDGRPRDGRDYVHGDSGVGMYGRSKDGAP